MEKNGYSAKNVSYRHMEIVQTLRLYLTVYYKYNNCEADDIVSN